MLGGGDNFPFFFGLLRGKNKNVLELPINHFKDIKKVADFPYVRGEGGSTHIWKIIKLGSRSKVYLKFLI